MMTKCGAIILQLIGMSVALVAICWGGGVADSVAFPNGFYQEGGGGFDQVAVGSKNGRMVAVGLKKGIPYFFDNQTMGADPWTVRQVLDEKRCSIAPLCEVAVASDGTLCGLSAKNHKVYRYCWPRAEAPTPYILLDKTSGTASSGGRWALLDDAKKLKIKHIAVGSQMEVWAIDEHDVLYRFADGSWALKARNASQVSVAYDGTVAVLSKAGHMFMRDGNRWEKIKRPAHLASIAVVSKDLMWGICHKPTANKKTVWRYVHGTWERQRTRYGMPATGMTCVAANAAETVFALDHAGNIYANGEDGVPMPVLAKQKCSVMTACNTMG